MTEGSERYWESRWRDEKAENERLTTLAEVLGKELVDQHDEIERLQGMVGEYATAIIKKDQGIKALLQAIDGLWTAMPEIAPIGSLRAQVRTELEGGK